jgi:transcriptional regulator with XRE-family HTH domain
MAADGLSARELARRASAARGEAARAISTSTVTRILSGETKTISRDVLAALQVALSMDLTTAGLQIELDLAITEDFVTEARQAIEEHVSRIQRDLNFPFDAKLIGVVGLRIEQTPGTRVYEKLFDVPLKWRNNVSSQNVGTP